MPKHLVSRVDPHVQKVLEKHIRELMESKDPRYLNFIRTGHRTNLIAQLKQLKAGEGKPAMIYSLANRLGFDVEIVVRRNGTDIRDKLFESIF